MKIALYIELALESVFFTLLDDKYDNYSGLTPLHDPPIIRRSFHPSEAQIINRGSHDQDQSNQASILSVIYAGNTERMYQPAFPQNR